MLNAFMGCRRQRKTFLIRDIRHLRIQTVPGVHIFDIARHASFYFSFKHMLLERAALVDEDATRDVLSRIRHAQIQEGDEL